MKQQYRRYWVKFGFRILILAVVVGIVVFRPEELDVLKGMNFFRRFCVLHVLWMLWAWYMLEKLIPLGKGRVPKGSTKYRGSEFCPTEEYRDYLAENEIVENETAENREVRQKKKQWEEAFRAERRRYGTGALRVLGVWIVMGAAFALAKQNQIFGSMESGIFLILSALFYIGDLVCLLIWCPFRDILMKNPCCTKCRIYNWDTLMLILPIAFVPGFYSYSLLALALLVVGIWEGNHLFHPERYYDRTNANLQCSQCKGELGCSRIRQTGKGQS